MDDIIRLESRNIVRLYCHQSARDTKKLSKRNVDIVVDKIKAGISPGVILSIVRYNLSLNKLWSIRCLKSMDLETIYNLYRKIESVNKRFNIEEHVSNENENEKFVDLESYIKKRLTSVRAGIKNENKDVVLVEEERRLLDMLQEVQKLET